MNDVTAQLRALVEGNHPARQVVTACTILARITPQVFEDCMTTIRTGTPAPVAETGPNLERLARFNQPHAAEPALRTSNYRPPGMPAPAGDGRRLWAGYMGKLNSCQPILRPAWVMPKPATPGQAIALLARLKHHGEHWHEQGQRAIDFAPVLEDAAHTLRGLVETDLAGWTTPRTIGTTACTNAGATAKCRISPVHAKGLCRPCYDQTRNGHTNDAN